MKKKQNLDTLEPPIVKILRSDLQNIRSFIAGECIKLAVLKNGVIDLKDDDFKKLINSMLNADPESEQNQGKATLSLKSSERGIQKKLQKEIANGAPSENFASFQEEISSNRDKLTKELSTLDGVYKLIGEKLQKGLLNTQTAFLDNSGNFIDKKTKDNITDQIQASMKDLPTEVIHTMLVSPSYKETVEQIIKASIDHNLGHTRKAEGALVLNSEALQSNLKKLTKNLNDQLSPEKIKAQLVQNILEKTIKNAGLEHKTAKISEKLKDTLSSLDISVLANNKLQENLTDSLKNIKRLSLKSIGKTTITNARLDEVATAITDNKPLKNNNLRKTLTNMANKAIKYSSVIKMANNIAKKVYRTMG